jgi:hypothetical protein
VSNYPRTKQSSIAEVNKKLYRHMVGWWVYAVCEKIKQNQRVGSVFLEENLLVHDINMWLRKN